MLLGAILVVYLKENPFEITDLRLDVVMVFWRKGIFKPTMVFIDVLQSPKKTIQIGAVKRAVHKTVYRFIALFVIHYKVKRRISHKLHQSLCVGDDTLSVAPCNGCRQKPRNFNIFLPAVKVRYLYRVCVYKPRMVVLGDLCFQKIFYVSVFEFQTYLFLNAKISDFPNKNLYRFSTFIL